MGKIVSVKVLGSGCAKCHKLLENVKVALKNKEIYIEAEFVTDIEKAMAYGVMSFPALIVNEKIASVGKVLSAEEIEKIIG